jgi:hypothetical protein
MPKKRVVPAAQRAAIEVVRARADESCEAWPRLSRRFGRRNELARHGSGPQQTPHPHPRGVGHWQATQVRRVLARLPS